MKTVLTISSVLALGIVIGITVNGSWQPDSQSSSEAKEKTPLYWVAPMDPNYRRDKPGLSPMGMELVPVFEESYELDNSVRVAAGVQQNLGVRTVEVVSKSASHEIHTSGFIQFDEEKLGHVHSRVEGWIEKLYPSSVGDPIQRGEALYTIYSPALVNAQDEFIGAMASKNQRLIEASRQRLLLLGFGPDQVEKLSRQRRVQHTVTIYSQHSGFISQLNIRDGMYIRPDTEVLSIADLSSVWVIAEVFERQSMLVSTGQQADITIDNLPGKHWRGKIDYIYPILDEKLRTIRVRIRLDNPEQQLKPNMFATVTIKSQDDEAKLYIPRAALIRGGRGDRVVTKLGDDRFKSVAVIAGQESGEEIEVLSGLQAGDRVVSSGQFLIDSESNIDSELARLDGPSEKAEEPQHDHHHHHMHAENSMGDDE